MSVERRNLVIAIVVSFLFGISGGVLGTIGTVAVLHHRGGPPPFLHGRGPGGPGDHDVMRPRDRRRPPMERLIHRQLGLTDEQQDRIDRILDDARPRYQAVRDSTRAEIDRVLTPEQRAKWKEIESRLPARRRGERAEP